MRGNDSVRTGPAVSWLVLRATLVVVVAAAGAALSPLIGWAIAAVVFALIAVVLPQTYAAWASIMCLVVGILIADPDIGRTLLAILAVHLIHVIATLSLVITPGSRIVIAALRPTALRFVLVQVIAQPLAFLVLLGINAGTVVVPWAIAAGACALIALAVVLIVSVRMPRH